MLFTHRMNHRWKLKYWKNQELWGEDARTPNWILADAVVKTFHLLLPQRYKSLRWDAKFGRLSLDCSKDAAYRLFGIINYAELEDILDEAFDRVHEVWCAGGWPEIRKMLSDIDPNESVHTMYKSQPPSKKLKETAS